MMQAIVDLFHRVMTLNVTNVDLVRIFLFLVMVGATVHLGTMLATRWGDRHVAFKSLMFSVVVHTMCWMGMTTIPPSAVPAAIPEKIVEPRTTIQRMVLESEEAIESPDQGNTPVWERLEADEPELARTERPTADFEPLAALTRDSKTIAPEIIEPSQLVEDSIDPAEAPSRALEGEEGKRQVATSRMEVEETAPEARAESQANLPSRTRTPIARIGTDELSPTRSSPRGSVERKAPDFSVDSSSIMLNPLDVADADVVTGDDEVIERKTGPMTAPKPDITVGSISDSIEAGAAGARGPERLDRASTRRRPETVGLSLEDAPTRIARTPVPLTEERNQVREGPALDSDSFLDEPSLVQPSDIDAPRSDRKISIPATYRLRNLANRKTTARKFGGTDESEKAVEMSLNWLASTQHPDGYWDADLYDSGQVEFDENGIDRQFAGKASDTGVTALAILAFLGAGYTHEEGQYADTVDRAIRWLMSQQDPEDGNLYGDATHFARMYCHAMATYALAEAYGMQSDPSSFLLLRLAVINGTQYIIRRQNPADGGWRYREGQAGDMSMFGWQLMALKSAEIAGISVPSKIRIRMIKFLRERASSRYSGRYGGLAAYRIGDRPTPTMTAEAMFCRQMLGVGNSGNISVEATEFLLRNLPSLGRRNLYYWYYGTLAMYQRGGNAWTEWNNSLRDMLIADQVQSGRLKGSWDPKPPWGPYGGRIYSTAIATLSLEVYYRFLPLYRFKADEESEGEN